MNTTLNISPLEASTAILNEVCPSGESWMGRITRGQTFRIVDLEGNQAVDTLFFNANNPDERYSAVDTIRGTGQLYLGQDSVLYSTNQSMMARITADTCGRHDTLGGACSCESNTVRYAMNKRPMHSCRDNFMYALSHHPIAHDVGLATDHLTANINFFMNVPVTTEGHLTFADGISGAGKYVELVAEMDLVILISNCPQLNNPCNDYNPTPIQLLVWDTVAANSSLEMTHV